MLCSYLDLWTFEPWLLLPPAGGVWALHVLLLLSTQETPWQKYKEISKCANKWITVIVWGSFRTLSWRKCWKWFCACRSMSLTSVSSAAFSLQTHRTFLERDIIENEELKMIWIIKKGTRRGFMFMFSTWDSSALVVCEVPLHDRRSETPGGGVSVNTASHSASALTSYLWLQLQEIMVIQTLMYLPGTQRVIEKFNFMVTLHLLQPALLHSLALNKLNTHTRGTKTQTWNI